MRDELWRVQNNEGLAFTVSSLWVGNERYIHLGFELSDSLYRSNGVVVIEGGFTIDSGEIDGLFSALATEVISRD